MAERTIPLRLSDFADLLDAQQAPHNLVLHMRAAAAEIERLRAALEDIAYGNPLHNEDDLMRIARAALEVK